MKAVLEHYRGNEQFVARILDLAEQSERQYRCIITPFLTPQEQVIAQKIIGKQLFVSLDGGYPEAEMKRMLLAPFLQDEEAYGIVCLRASYRMQEKRLTHRDVLGALLHLGIERNQFGDLLVDEQTIHLFVKEELRDFLMGELHQIARYHVDFTPYEGVIEHKVELAWHSKTVASLRLDCIVAACIHQSRGKAESLIRGKLVKLNHLPLEDCKVLCNNNCTVSIRGYGRFLVKILDRTSKKGRIVIEIGAYK